MDASSGSGSEAHGLPEPTQVNYCTSSLSNGSLLVVFILCVI